MELGAGIDGTGETRMDIVPVICPACGAKVQVAEGTRSCYCTYCGTQMYLDDGSKTVTYQMVDEARIRESDNAAAVELKKLEMEEAARARKMKVLKWLAIASGALFVLGLLVALADRAAGSLICMTAGLIMLYGALFMFLNNRRSSDEAQKEPAREEKPEGSRKSEGRSGLALASAVTFAASLAVGLLGLWKMRK